MTVHDSQGAAVEGAAVQITPATPKVTDVAGLARFEKLPCDTYVVRVTKPGFDEVSTEAIKLDGPTPADVAVILTPASDRRDSVDVHDTVASPVQESSTSQPLERDVAKNLPSRPATVADALPALPGIVRAPDGSLKINSSGEHRSALLINKTDVTDPATGMFGQTVPVDSIEEVNVLKTPFMAQYGRFTAGVVSVETRRGGDQWHSELNDPFPDFRFRSWHMNGIRDTSPRGVLSGPLIENRLYFAETLLYDLRKTPNKTLPYPYNESKQQVYNSFTQMDYILSAKQVLTGTLHVTPLQINFVNPDYFMPQPVTPSYQQKEYTGTLMDHYTLGGGMLSSTLSFQRFDATVGSQGPGEMMVYPTGNTGNYFSNQNREAGRDEWLETWSPAEHQFLGQHGFEFGTVIARTSNVGELTARPVNFFDPEGILLRRITYTGGQPYNRSDVDSALFAQDHWTILPNLAMDLGSRFERQTIAESFRIAPRAGLAWTPFGSSTVFRAGYGVFYDRVPLNVYSFEHYPQQVITDYAVDGSALGVPLVYQNVTGTAYFNGSLLIHSPNEPGNFAPHSATWNLQLERTFSRFLKLRATYTDSDSSGLVVMQPQVGPNSQSAALMLNGNGSAKYRQAEISARVAWSSSFLFLAYTHSKAEGDLNDFGGFLGNFPAPVIRPNLYSLLPSDLPNRFLAWGQLVLPHGIRLLPMVEYRNGFPYASYDVLGNYVGTPYQNNTRYPDSLSLDARVSKDFKINSKYTVRLSVGGTNLTNHFNALAIHSNIADPQYGAFFGNYNRRFLADFDILF